MKVDFKPSESVKEAADGTIYTRTAAHPERLRGPLGDPWKEAGSLSGPPVLRGLC